MNDSIQRAVKVVGSQAALAKHLNIHCTMVSQWVTGRRPVAVEHCPAIERITCGAVRCEDFYPDVEWGYLRGTDKVSA